ncbi:MAG: hypothetical protein AAGA96_12650 [Verrucomicrobiota bacterium]
MIDFAKTLVFVLLLAPSIPTNAPSQVQESDGCGDPVETETVKGLELSRSKPINNKMKICTAFKAPDEEDFIEQIRATGKPIEKVYFSIGCDAGVSGNHFDLLRFAVRKISTHFDMAMLIVDEFYSERDGDPDHVSEEEKQARALLTCAVTSLYRDQMNILQEIDRKVQYIKSLLKDDPDFKEGTDAREQALKDLENLEILRKDLEYTVETYPTTILVDGCPSHCLP